MFKRIRLVNQGLVSDMLGTLWHLSFLLGMAHLLQWSNTRAGVPLIIILGAYFLGKLNMNDQRAGACNSPGTRPVLLALTMPLAALLICMYIPVAASPKEIVDEAAPHASSFPLAMVFMNLACTISGIVIGRFRLPASVTRSRLSLTGAKMWRKCRQKGSAVLRRLGSRRLRAPSPSECMEKQAPPTLAPFVSDEEDENKDTLPPIDLLDSFAPEIREDIASDADLSGLIKQTLTEFGIKAEIGNRRVGPRLTTYEIKMGAGVRLKELLGIWDDLALRLGPVRIIYPTSGDGFAGIEVPNKMFEPLQMRSVVADASDDVNAMALPLFLGKNSEGRSVVADLSLMPHLLVAGSSGSGKSMCLVASLLSIMLSCLPKEVKLVLFDPKYVGFSKFKNTPHLARPVIIDKSHMATALEEVLMEVERRFELLERAGVYDIDEYNRLAGSSSKETRLYSAHTVRGNSHFFKLTRIVVAIDELADLLLTTRDTVESTICRIAAKSRAVGIHMILATQRPSADIVTGLIKANFPARIAFKTASQVDSRIILGFGGAERLLGRGDMLYLPADGGPLTRLQGPMVSPLEIKRVGDHYQIARQRITARVDDY